MALTSPGITDLKMLFARSGNQCSFPKCRVSITSNKTLIGEVCHIKGTRLGSARHDPSQSDAERHNYSNLILLCPNHHTVIDDDEVTYTVERLQQIKAAHETQVAPMSESDSIAAADLFTASVMSIGQSGGISAHTVNATTITLQNAPSSSHLTHQRQLRAIEELWRVVRNLRSEFSAVVLANTIFLDDELDAHFSGRDTRLSADLVEYSDIITANRKFERAGANDADAEQPFVSHRLWSVFYILRAIYGRTALLVTNSYKKKAFVSWREDSGCDQLLRHVLTDRVVEDAKKQELGGLQTIIGHLESHFLAAAGMNTPGV